MSNAFELLQDKKVFLFDLDGTLYLGDKIFPGAVEFINHLRADGKKVVFLTNNATRSDDEYISLLTERGFSPTPEEILTAGDVTISYIKEHRAGKSVYLVGTPGLYDMFVRHGIPMACDRDGNVTGKADIVVTSFDTTLNYDKLTAAANFIRGGAEFFSTHADLVCPSDGKILPDSGTVAAAVEAASGVSPRFFGKPEIETVDMICSRTGAAKEEMCVFGDRLYTDIALGKKNGMVSCLVLTGECSEEDYMKASRDKRPDVVFRDIAEADETLYSAVPAPEKKPFRTKLRDRLLPKYTKGEEIFNMVSHIAGGAFGVAYLVMCVIVSAMHRDPWAVVGSSIYGASCIMLFTMSSVYHGLRPSMAKKVFQVIDHCTINFMIAGTYTPIALCSLRRENAVVGWIIFGVVWGVAAMSITFTAIDLKRFSKLSMVCYLMMGWCIVFSLKMTIRAVTPAGMLLLLIGGVLYTLGAVLYGVGKKKKYIHSVFHIFVVLASLAHFLCILLYVI